MQLEEWLAPLTGVGSGGDHFWCLGKQHTTGVEILIAGGESESSRGSQM